MPIVQTRVFRRIVATSTELNSAITAVTSEANTFLASLPNLGDALDLHTTLSPVDKYGDNMCFAITITYVET